MAKFRNVVHLSEYMNKSAKGHSDSVQSGQSEVATVTEDHWDAAIQAFTTKLQSVEVCGRFIDELRR